MTVFGQLGDPVAGAAACLCEHHGAVYASLVTSFSHISVSAEYDIVPVDTVITQAQITTTERCCIVINAATIGDDAIAASALEIERPVGTVRTMQEDAVNLNELTLLHHAAWEVLVPGTYTYFLVNRSGLDQYIFGAWLKIIASDCEG